MESGFVMEFGLQNESGFLFAFTLLSFIIPVCFQDILSLKERSPKGRSSSLRDLNWTA